MHKEIEHTPEFDRRAAAVMNSPYWANIEGATAVERQGKQDAFHDALMNAADYDDLPPEMRKIFDDAEAELK